MYSLNTTHERRLLWLVMLTQFTIIMDFMVMMPLGPQIISAFHITPAAFATAVSTYSWCAGLSGLLAMTYIDRFDRRKLMLIVYVLFVFSNLACALANSYLMLLLSRAFAGLSGGVLGSIIMAIIADVIPVSRRGAATGTIMTAFSIASVIGVPIGVLLGAHFSWSAPFFLLVVLSLVIWLGGISILPALNQHLSHQVTSLSQVMARSFQVFTNKRHLNAFILTFMTMTSSMLVIPFILPILVTNHGIEPAQISWVYMAGGIATFFTARAIGRLADQYGKHRVFRVIALLSIIPILLITHLPDISFIILIFFFTLFMVLVSGRMIPMQALLTTVPQPSQRGAFLSANSAIQSLGTGFGAWFGGLLLTTNAQGQLVGYGTIGWIAVVIAVFAVIWIGRVQSVEESSVPTAFAGEAQK